MHGPVGTSGLAVLPGPVERVDDPYTVRAETGKIVCAFFGEHCVLGKLGLERTDEPLVAPQISHPADLIRIRVCSFEAESELEEQLACSSC